MKIWRLFPIALLGLVALPAQAQTPFAPPAAIRVHTRVVSASTDSPSATLDYFLCVTYTATGSVTITLPAGVTGLTLLVKDCGGSAAANNITVNPAAGNIDGAGSFVLNVNYQAAAFTYVNGQWSVN